MEENLENSIKKWKSRLKKNLICVYMNEILKFQNWI